MKAFIRKGSLFLLFALLSVACSSEKEPSSPKETFRTYSRAVKQKDITTMKLLLSAESIKMHEQEAKAQGVTLDDIVKRETLLNESQTVVKVRNEKIEGEKATLEVENSMGIWETIPFIFEGGEWKIDKKGYQERLMRDIEEINQQQLDDVINKGRIDPSNSQSTEGGNSNTPINSNTPTITDANSDTNTNANTGAKRPSPED